MECSFRLREGGPTELRSLGETEKVARIAESASAKPWLGIIGFVDLGLGARASGILERHVEAANGRLVGIRHVAAWHADPLLRHERTDPPQHLLLDAEFRAGFACLAPLDLAFDAWLYHTQLEELADLAKAFPETTIVLNHLGGPIGIGPFAGRSDEVFAPWRSGIEALAHHANVFVKLGGLAMRLGGFGLHDRSVPASSEELASKWQRYVDVCLGVFGPQRCMFESNFPVDREAVSYAVLWNAFKRMSKHCSPGEKERLFSATASEAYGLAGHIPSHAGRRS